MPSPTRPPGPSLDPLVQLGLELGNTVGTQAGGVVSGLQAGASAPAAAIDAIIATKRWLGDRHNWIRIMWFGIGSAMVTMGAAVLVRHPVGNAVDTAIKAVK